MSVLYILVLPPVLVPRYSEYPSGMSNFQPAPEPTMPYNVSFPHGFQMSPGGSSGPASPYCLSSMKFSLILLPFIIRGTRMFESELGDILVF